VTATFGHPLWISSGIILFFIGVLLFRWARANDVSAEVSAATREATLTKLLKGGQTPDGQVAAKKIKTNNFRRAMSQLFGIVGFLLAIAGLMAATLGIFYPVG
jgi:hypothetical protein